VLFAKSIRIFQFAPLTGLVQVIVALLGTAPPEVGARVLMVIAPSTATNRRFDNGIVDRMLVTCAEPAEADGNIRGMTQRLVIPSREEVDSERHIWLCQRTAHYLLRSLVRHGGSFSLTLVRADAPRASTGSRRDAKSSSRHFIGRRTGIGSCCHQVAELKIRAPNIRAFQEVSHAT